MTITRKTRATRQTGRATSGRMPKTNTENEQLPWTHNPLRNTPGASEENINAANRKRVEAWKARNKHLTRATTGLRLAVELAVKYLADPRRKGKIPVDDIICNAHEAFEEAKMCKGEEGGKGEGCDELTSGVNLIDIKYELNTLLYSGIFFQRVQTREIRQLIQDLEIEFEKNQF